MVKLASPFYILRHEAERDFWGTLEKVAEIGFEGAELFGLFGKSAQETDDKLKSLSLKAVGDHVTLTNFLADVNGVITAHKRIGCRYLSIGVNTDLTDPAAFEDAMRSLKMLSRRCVDAGITPLYHNHDTELQNGTQLLDRILESCEQDGLRFEIDVGWVAYKEIDTVPLLIRYKDRCPVIHLKDLYARELGSAGLSKELGEEPARPEKGYFEFRPVGYGMVNIPRLLPYCLDCNPEWIVLDHDLAYKRSPFDDLELSFDYTKNLLKFCE